MENFIHAVIYELRLTWSKTYDIYQTRNKNIYILEDRKKERRYTSLLKCIIYITILSYIYIYHVFKFKIVTQLKNILRKLRF